MNLNFCFFCFGIIAEVVSQENRNMSWEKHKRSKREEEKWIWGFVELEKENRILFDESFEEIDPCIPVEYPAPIDFGATGRRISTVKCYEYMWNIKVISEEAKRNEACAENFLSIVGGVNSKPGEYPHMAALGWMSPEGTWVFKCAGTLISNQYVLSAAHCSSASERDTSVAELHPRIVRLGVTNINDNHGKIDVNISEIIKHPEYVPPKKYNDIALVKLEKEVKFTRSVYPACVYNENDQDLVNQTATITGWGVQKMGDISTPSDLQVGEVDILESRKCSRLFINSCNRLWCGIKESQLCAGKLAGGVDACQGDSGGPLQQQIKLPNHRKERVYRVVGVTSFGVGCALAKLPGIYTRVSSFVDWIEDVVWNNR